jgi:hypothetical protein
MEMRLKYATLVIQGINYVEKVVTLEASTGEKVELPIWMDQFHVNCRVAYSVPNRFHNPKTNRNESGHLIHYHYRIKNHFYLIVLDVEFDKNGVYYEVDVTYIDSIGVDYDYVMDLPVSEVQSMSRIVIGSIVYEYSHHIPKIIKGEDLTFQNIGGIIHFEANVRGVLNTYIWGSGLLPHLIKK